MDNKQAEKLAGAAAQFVEAMERIAAAMSHGQQAGELQYRIMLWLKRFLASVSDPMSHAEAQIQLLFALESWLALQGGDVHAPHTPNGYVVVDGRASPIPDGANVVHLEAGAWPQFGKRGE